MLLFCALSACASGQAGAPANARDADVLTPAQWDRLGTLTLLQVVQALRPHWLSTRGFDSLTAQGDVVIFRDGVMLGGPSTLNELRNTDVASLRHFDGPSATARWGICCGHGVIYVSTLDSKGSP